MLTYCLLIGLLFSMSACGGDAAAPTLVQYVAAQEALADDDAGRAQQALAQMAEQATGTLKSLAANAASSGDIDAIRRAFKPLSAEMIQGDVPEGYVRAFCPMADSDRGAHWIQKDGPSIINPYFGASMLHCGVFKD